MKKFTVVLLYPDYAADDYGADQYIASVYAENMESAVSMAQAEAATAIPDLCEIENPEDFRPVLVLDGFVRILARATDF